MKTIIFLVSIICFFACTQNETVKKQDRTLPANMEYNYDCVTQSSKVNKITNLLSQADEYLTTVATNDIEVTDKEQTEYGNTFLTESKKNKSFKLIENTAEAQKLNFILTNLLRVRKNPSGIIYKTYLLDDDSTINAYTIGGKIFVSTAIVKKCANDDQLYAIIGHEIGHNEKGHIKENLMQLKKGEQYFGKNTELVLSLKNRITGVFNQKKEVEADYYGLDLSYQLGYDVCAVKSFWDDMAKKENKDLLQDFFGTHPYSNVRSNCLTKHIKNNFKQACD